MKEKILEGKIVIVTGGAGLLGGEFCRAIAAEGAHCVIADRDSGAAAGAVERLRAQLPGARTSAVRVDITSKESLDTMIAGLHAEHGRIDALVNNAYPRNPRYGRSFFEVEYADFCDNVGLHLGGYFLASQRLADYFSRQGGGNIVNVSSIYGVMPPRFEVYEGTPMTMPVEYAAVKSALLHLTRYMAKYLKGRGIRVNAISPGGIANGQPETFLAKYNAHGLSKGMLEARDLAGTLIYLLSDLSAYVNGQNVIVDDGYSL